MPSFRGADVRQRIADFLGRPATTLALVVDGHKLLPCEGVIRLAYKPTGESLAAACWDGSLHIVSSDSGEVLHETYRVDVWKKAESSSISSVERYEEWKAAKEQKIQGDWFKDKDIKKN